MRYIYIYDIYIYMYIYIYILYKKRTTNATYHHRTASKPTRHYTRTQNTKEEKKPLGNYTHLKSNNVLKID